MRPRTRAWRGDPAPMAQWCWGSGRVRCPLRTPDGRRAGGRTPPWVSSGHPVHGQGFDARYGPRRGGPCRCRTGVGPRLSSRCRYRRLSRRRLCHRPRDCTRDETGTGEGALDRHTGLADAPGSPQCRGLSRRGRGVGVISDNQGGPRREVFAGARRDKSGV